MKISSKSVKVLLAILLILGGIGTYYYSQRGEVSTDSATIDGCTVVISPKVSGYVKALNVQDNQQVKAGDVFLEIAPTDYAQSGGSIGIALITSRLVHSQQIQQSNLVQHLTAADSGYGSALSNYTQAITNLGVPAAQAVTTAMGHIYQELLHQATILAYLDAYHLLAIILIVLSIAALFVPNNIQAEKGHPEGT